MEKIKSDPKFLNRFEQIQQNGEDPNSFKEILKNLNRSKVMEKIKSDPKFLNRFEQIQQSGEDPNKFKLLQKDSK